MCVDVMCECVCVCMFIFIDEKIGCFSDACMHTCMYSYTHTHSEARQLSEEAVDAKTDFHA